MTKKQLCSIVISENTYANADTMSATGEIMNQKVETVPAQLEKLFGGCGCGSPWAVKLPDGNFQLHLPSAPDRGSLILTAQELKALRGMVVKAEKENRL